MRTSQAGQSALLLLDAVAILDNLKIPYAVIGAMAASVHGAVRASVDADAVLSTAIGALGSLEKEFQKSGFKTELRRGGSDDPIPALLALLDSHGNRVDLLAGIRGLDPAAFSRTANVPFEGENLRIIGLEDFVAMKAFAGSPKDLEDARQAIAVAGSALNRSLLEKLAARFGRETLRVLRTLL